MRCLADPADADQDSAEVRSHFSSFLASNEKWQNQLLLGSQAESESVVINAHQLQDKIPSQPNQSRSNSSSTLSLYFFFDPVVPDRSRWLSSGRMANQGAPKAE